MTCCNRWLCVALLAVAFAPASVAQPPFPPPPGPRPNPLEGIWYFRGDLQKPCVVETVTGPRGTRLLFTNENGNEASGQFSPNGRRVTVPGWKLNGTVRGDRLIWANGDFWSR